MASASGPRRPTGPLAGVRVLDASQGAVGPWAGSLLGQMGADVVKLEAPQGDFIRGVMPAKRGLASTYISMNSNKRSIVLDLKRDEDRSRAHALAARADVFIENFRPGVAERIGIGYAALCTLNPRLIYASGSGFGAVGPMVPIGATDPHIQAFTGSTSVNGPEGEPGQRWRWYGHFDCTTALLIVQAVLAALFERVSSGRGQYLELTMVEAALALQRVRLSEHLGGGRPRPMGSATTYLVPDQAFRTQDRPIAVSATSPRQWRSLCGALGLAELAADPRFATNPCRVENRETLLPLLQAAFVERPMQHWLEKLRAVHVPCAGFTSFDEFRYHVHYLRNEMVRFFATQEFGTLCVGGSPWSFTRTPGSLWPCSLPGAHTDEIVGGDWPAP